VFLRRGEERDDAGSVARPPPTPAPERNDRRDDREVALSISLAITVVGVAPDF
jgi:hypothetical protein